jgi:Smr domain/Domain of unknown function (DUF2027)
VALHHFCFVYLAIFIQNMATIHIGDRVRLVHSKEEGIVTRFMANQVIEVEIEDGFKLPVMQREVVLVSAAEAVAFKGQQADKEIVVNSSTPKTVRADKGIFMAFVSLNDRELALHLVNNSDWDLPYTLTATQEKLHRGLSGGLLKAKSSVKVQDFSINNFDNWGIFTFQCLYYTFGHAPEKSPIVRKLRLRADAFFKSKANAPLLNKEAYMIQLDTEHHTQTITAADLKEKILEPKIEKVALPIAKPNEVIDLHIEKLTTNLIGLSSSEMLAIQLSTFEKNLDNAIASGMTDITFIHGIGNGVLKTEIHRKLSKNQYVRHFEDAQKEKFGYGATKAKFK